MPVLLVIPARYASSRYPGKAVLEEARESFANTVLPRDFDTIDVPYPDRGTPQVLRWDRETQSPVPVTL